MNWNDIGEFIQTVAIVSVPIIEYFGLNQFNASYMEEKGRNLATKEDVQELTSLAEEIKLLYQSKQHQNENIYNIKKDTILESLDFLDDYLSWLSYETNIIPIRNDINESKLTLKARKCYNKLVLTCKTKELPEIFLKIIFDDTLNKMELYNRYRNLSRHEMGLEMDLELDKESVFISKVSTNDLA